MAAELHPHVTVTNANVDGFAAGSVAHVENGGHDRTIAVVMANRDVLGLVDFIDGGPIRGICEKRSPIVDSPGGRVEWLHVNT